MTAGAIPPDDEMLAAELALDLLEPAERAPAEARLQSDAGFAAAHRFWQDRAVALLDGPGEMPRPSLWRAIEAKLPANDSGASAARSLRWWQGGTAIAVAASMVLAVVAVRRPGETPAPIAPYPVAATAPLIAVLTGPDSKAVVTVSYDPANGRITSAPVGLKLDHHDAELWVIPAGAAGQKPRSLGVIVPGAPNWRTVPARGAAAIGRDATFAISVEPIGGSPTGQPTGPVILTGKIATT